MTVLLPVLLCLVSGYLLVCIGWPRPMSGIFDYLFRISLSVGFGLGIFSVTYFLSLIFGGTHFRLLDLVVVAMLLAGFWWRTRTGPARRTIVERSNHAETTWLYRFLSISFILALVGSLYSAVTRVRAFPHGDGWDAFSIWNLHARFLFLSGSHWHDGFSSLLPWSHPDYPLFLPSAIAHFWTYLGYDSPAVPAVIGFLFTFSTVGLLFSTLSMLRGRLAAILGTIALLCTPAFIELGTAQYADVPLSFFLLATLAMLCLHDCQTSSDTAPELRPRGGLLAMAALAAGFAAWTKNEGLLFLCAVVVARVVMMARIKDFSKNRDAFTRAIMPMLVVIVPAFLLIAAFKHYIAPPGDLFSDSSTSLHKLMDPSRYWAIIRWYVKGFFRFGRWLLIPGSILMVGFYFVAGKEENSKEQMGIRTSGLALALTLAGYFAVYLVTPYDIYWHLRFSLTRLFLQLWPSAILLFFLLVNLRGPVEAEATSSAP